MPIKIKNKAVTIRTIGGHIYGGIVADVCSMFIKLRGQDRLGVLYIPIDKIESIACEPDEDDD